MILDYNEFKEGPYHEVARLRRYYNNKVITDKIEFHYIQLPKFIESVKEIKGDEEIWLAYISNQLNEMEKGELINMKKSIEEINAIVDEVMNDEDVYNALTIRELDEYDRRSALSYAEEKGERKKQIEVAKKLLENKIDIDIIIKTTGLTKEEIENIDELEWEIN